MPFPKIEDIKDLSSDELAEQILATKRQLFELRLQKATRRLEKTHEFKHAKHRLAQLLTVEGERQRSAAAQSQASSSSAQ
jgi:large subunit ribosomal protein L29